MSWKKKSITYTVNGTKSKETGDLNVRQELSGYLIYLISCALHDITPDKKIVEAVDLEALYNLSSAHSLTSIVCIALEKADAFSSVDWEISKKWTEARNKAIRKNILLDAERKQIFLQMDKLGIWHMPLKGSILKELYPKYGARQMADNDILFDASRRADVKSIMVERGYKVSSYGKGHHDVYEKPPIYNYEMHTALFDTTHRKVWQNYYNNIEKRLLSDGDGSCGYHFTDEDFYIFLIAHGCKHFDGGGTGLRSLLDCYVYVQKKGNALNWKYIEEELQKLDIAEFELKTRTLAINLFSAPVLPENMELTESDQEFLSAFIDSGTYGTMETRVKNSMNQLRADGKKTDTGIKIQYCLKRLFPDMGWYESNVPFCSRHKWAIPFYIVFRIMRGVLFGSGRICAELRVVRGLRGNMESRDN
ncbi:MAG: nucleotidyltransferase family protein [Eubacteriales bacterium]|nr:nucleotidyltransferase family protein [Eubacteriales bacterium]